MLARECLASRSRSPACAALATRRQVRSPSHTPYVPGRPVDRQTDKIQIQIPSRAHVRHSRCVRVSWKNQIPLFSRRCSSLLAVRIVVCLSVTATTTRRSLYSLCIRVFVYSCVFVCVSLSLRVQAAGTPQPPERRATAAATPTAAGAAQHALAAAVTVAVAATHPTDTFACAFEFVFNSATSCYGCRRVVSVSCCCFRQRTKPSTATATTTLATLAPRRQRQRANQTFELFHILTLITRWIKLLKH